MDFEEFRRLNRRGTQSEPPPELDRLAYAVIGAAIESPSGAGAWAQRIPLRGGDVRRVDLREITFARQFDYGIEYKGKLVGKGRIDLLVGNDLIVELKACDGFAPIHTAQILSYMRATGRKLGLINFNVLLLQDGIKRVVLS